MSDPRPVTLSSGLPETNLPPAPPALVAALAAAADRDAVSAIVRANPRWIDGWSALAALGRDDMEQYAAYRVGYHRGLDALRANGWRGSGYVRWRNPANRGFLAALEGLGRLAAKIGEHDEAERIELFLHQLDPDWDRRQA